jgi:hypothetical protein
MPFAKYTNTMRNLTAIIFFTAIIFYLSGCKEKEQKDTGIVLKEKAQIVSSVSRSWEITPFLFTPENTLVLLKQVSQERLDSIKNNCSEKNYPECFLKLIHYDVNREGAYEEMERILSTLKTYRIAKFNHVVAGENLGEESILLVPANENKNINGSCNLTKDIYIILLSGEIKIIK